MDLGIKGKVALVSGGARSLGKQDCLTLAAEGCKIVILDLNAEGAEATAKEITDARRDGPRLRGGHHRPAHARRHVARAESEVGPVDICVNNAGWIYTMGQLKDMRDEDWDSEPRDQPDRDLQRHEGRLSRHARAEMGPGDLHGIDRRPARRLRPDGVLDQQDGRGGVCQVGGAGGRAIQRHVATSSPRASSAPTRTCRPLYERMVKRVAMQKEGQPEDIANAIAFLCSERARYITGAVLTITGGMDLFTF